MTVHAQKTMRIVLITLVLTGLMLANSQLQGGKRRSGRGIDISKYDFRSGDIVLQHLHSRLGSVIADVTNSQYSHFGLVVMRNGKPYVLEAIGPVRVIRIEDWLKQGHKARFTQLRPKLSERQIDRAIAEARKFLGRPYDIQYELDDGKIYCSELVYKAFVRSVGIQIGKKERLDALNWKPHATFIRMLVGGELPLGRLIVTPESLVQSPNVRLVYSTFPRRRDEPVYSLKSLAGTWRGNYTIARGRIATVQIQFGPQGEFEAGALHRSSTSSIRIRSFDIERLRNRRAFVATLVDTTGIRARITAEIRDGGGRIIGTWNDSLGNTGILSLGKISGE